ncbi:MAG TPA: PilN domain-containing protein [Acidobacteriota bacterium]|nr:PilN domain-containing protein [Acidobacteriota bacterium]
MIRVNLLRDQTVRVRKTAARPTVSRMGLVTVAIFLVFIGGMGSYWYSVSREIGALTQTRDRLRRENDRLQGLKKEIEKYQSLKLIAQGRIEVIEKLKEFQTGPVSLMNHLIQSIPRDSSLWLTLVDQKADRIAIRGYAFRNEAVADFMTNLAATGFFKSVDLEVLESDKEASKFSLICITPRKLPSE